MPSRNATFKPCNVFKPEVPRYCMLELAVDRESIASLLPAPKLPMKYVGIGACLLLDVYA